MDLLTVPECTIGSALAVRQPPLHRSAPGLWRQVCGRWVPRANPFISIPKKVATLWPIFCSTTAIFFFSLSGFLGMHNSPRLAGSVRIRTILTVIGSVSRILSTHDYGASIYQSSRAKRQDDPSCANPVALLTG